jgi:hypothetical protein
MIQISRLTAALVGMLGAFPTVGGTQPRMLSGRVIDSATARPVVGANVAIDGMAHGAMTDSGGQFRILAP